ncbi:MAG: polyhydroxyalkanoate synthesis repressor PhaR [Neisseriaceae bacterium]|nr:polyhydroxyalkanoate synthesis repressor PhaR [Neisseriaceae bacterium]
MSLEKRVIKKYPNRRLYDTTTSSYITLVDVKQLILEFAQIKVIDAKTEKDITRTILLQIVLEEETGVEPLFSADVLLQFIRFYGHASQSLMGPFLERNLQVFNQLNSVFQNQDLVKQSTLGNPFISNSALAANLWQDMLTNQPQEMQTMIQTYMNQNTQTWLEIQQRMQEQSNQLLQGLTPAKK